MTHGIVSLLLFLNKRMQSKTMALVQWKLLYNILSLFSAALLLLVNQEILNEIVQRAPEKTRLGSSLIAGIDKISITIYESLGQRFLCES